MIYGTILLESDTELFIAALTQTPVYVWSLDPLGVYYQVDSGFIVKYTPDEVRIHSDREENGHVPRWYSRDTTELSIRS